MKRGELERQIRQIARAKGENAVFTEGGSHIHVTVGDKQITMPRHHEINELTAKGILKYLKETK